MTESIEGRILFKCRLCGEVYRSRHNPDWKVSLRYLSFGSGILNHHCKDGRVGISDIVGVDPSKKNRELISPEEHNSRATRKAMLPEDPWPSGVACSACGAEMLITPGKALLTHPPRTPVRCPACGFRTSLL